MSSQSLKNFWQSIKRDRYLLLALFIGLILRALNPTFGSPSLYVSNDEAIAHLAAWNMLANHTPVSIANYTPLGAYIQIPLLMASFLVMRLLGFVSGIENFELFILTHEGYFIFIPRLISALFGTLTILVAYKMAYAFFDNKRVAIIAAFLTAVSFNLVHISHFGRPWSAALFFFMLAMYFAIRNKISLSFISVGLSYGFHQVGILAVPLIFWLTKKQLLVKNSAAIVVMILMIVTFNYLTLNSGLIKSIRNDQSFLKSGKLAADFVTGNWDLKGSAVRSFTGNLLTYFTVNFLVTDGLLLLFSVWGILRSLRSNDPKVKVVYYIIFYFLFASFFFHPLLRYLLPIIVLTIPFAAYGISSIFGGKVVLVIAVVIIASINSLWWNSLILKKPTFIATAEWISENIPPEVPIAYTGGRYQTFVPNQKAIDHVQMVDKEFYRRLFKFSPSEDLDNVRNIVYASNFPGRTKLDNFKNSTVNYPVVYVVDYYIDPSDRLYSSKADRFELVKQFNPTRSKELVGIPEALFDASWNFPTNDSRKKVSMYSLSSAGPYVDILKVKAY